MKRIKVIALMLEQEHMIEFGQGRYWHDQPGLDSEARKRIVTQLKIAPETFLTIRLNGGRMRDEHV